MKRDLSFRREVRLRSLSAVVLALILSGPGQAAPNVMKEASTSVVYVESNLADKLRACFSPRSGRRLRKIGEFPTGGKGVFDLSLRLGPFDSDQELLTNAVHTLLFAVDRDRIASLCSKSSRTEASHRERISVPSGGTDPVSVGVAGNHWWSLRIKRLNGQL